MKYYLIWKRAEIGKCFVEPLFIVENKDIAEHFCNKNKNWYYFSEEDTKENNYEQRFRGII